MREHTVLTHHPPLVCTETLRVFAFGSNKFGELGLGHNASTTTPVYVETLKDSITKVACGRYHSAAIDCEEIISHFVSDN